MQFALCLLASLLIVGDALRQDYGDFDGPQKKIDANNWNKKNIDDDDEYSLELKSGVSSDYNFIGDYGNYDNGIYDVMEKRSRPRSQVDNDRGNRDMPDKFQREMTQCHVIYKSIDLFQHFNRGEDEVEFHESHFNQTQERLCVPVRETDPNRRKNPCAYFPSNGIVPSLCYVHSQNGCKTIMKREMILMRKINPNVRYIGNWFPNYVNISAGCSCNVAWHY